MWNILPTRGDRTGPHPLPHKQEGVRDEEDVEVESEKVLTPSYEVREEGCGGGVGVGEEEEERRRRKKEQRKES